MNKYAARSILLDAFFEARRFIVVERDGHAVREALHVFREALEAMSQSIPIDAKVRQANGAEAITFPGLGCVTFATPRSSRLRGQAANVVFIDNDAHRVLGEDADSYDRFRLDVALCLDGRGGEVVHS